jgi:hypothetical protein
VSSERLVPLIEQWTRPIVRVHHSRFGATEFNPGTAGSGGRFHPFQDRKGHVVPTLYASNSLNGALSETIFHDVPLRGPRRVSRSALMPLQASTIRATRPLHLIQLRGFGLDRLGVSRRELIDTDAEQYEQTRAWAAALYASVPGADGMLWVARLHDVAAAIVLFGTRVARKDLEIIAPPRPLAPDDAIDQDVMAAAQAARITISLP